MQSIAIDRAWNGEMLHREHHISVTLTMNEGQLWIEISAPFYNDPPPEKPAGFTHGLWNFEVVELFIVGEKQAYIELEFGPFGHYLGYRFNGIRNQDGVVSSINYVATIDQDRWHGKATIPLRMLPKTATSAWRINATAIHGPTDGRIYQSHIALPGDKPDYHQPAVFTTPLIG